MSEPGRRKTTSKAIQMNGSKRADRAEGRKGANDIVNRSEGRRKAHGYGTLDTIRAHGLFQSWYMSFFGSCNNTQLAPITHSSLCQPAPKPSPAYQRLST